MTIFFFIFFSEESLDAGDGFEYDVKLMFKFEYAVEVEAGLKRSFALIEFRVEGADLLLMLAL